MKIVLIGDALIDYQYWVQKMPGPGSDEAIISAAENPGGSALNTAFALSALGIQTAFCGSVGTDTAGNTLLSLMHKAGIAPTLVQQLGTTGYTITMIDRQGERTMFSYRGASARIRLLTADIRDAIEHSHLLFISGYFLTTPEQAEFAMQAAHYARSQNILTMLDAAPTIATVDEAITRRILSVTDIFSPNKAELATVTGTDDEDRGLRVITRTVPCTTLKLGARGAKLFFTKDFPFSAAPPDEAIYVPARKIAAVDSTGAGDAFNAGFIAAYLAGAAPEDCLRKACTLAEQAVMRRGATAVQ
jgi:sugar/nucleoside kinase (ribokinase family)